MGMSRKWQYRLSVWIRYFGSGGVSADLPDISELGRAGIMKFAAYGYMEITNKESADSGLSVMQYGIRRG
ncbi:hypothetical protein Metlim_1818 [Methanoplanus limicola DSM 2279]|uniref:Uncharacterized protein n=1 Tax=Methanoplanus limicola DSM 2279 TaxID=937775 RepID=H1YXS0_9EURY|nr:hypothetical protein Metlim_1818 [Methanoplanus limicola DSM 2279]